MNKSFELWLDESGKFKNESELKRLHLNPSLVGGILIEKDEVKNSDVTDLMDETHTHATEFSDTDKKNIALSVLSTLQKDYYAREVFFENSAYEDKESNRELYLNIMAEGLLQLMQTLNAEWGTVAVEVFIAQRQDVDATDSQPRRINEREYVNTLRNLMAQKRKFRRILLDEDSELKFAIGSAYSTKKLQMADFACNTRLTRASRAFVNCREKLDELYKDAYIFSLHEVSTDNYVNQCLTQGYIADAMLEIFTCIPGESKKRRTPLVERLVNRMEHESYRERKLQLRQCASDIISYTSMQDDYEVAEKVFILIHEEMIQRLKEENIDCVQFEFTILLWLSDNYLREGDIISARKCIETCRKIQLEAGDSLEEVFSYYQLIEKESLLAINEFDFEMGMNIMTVAREAYEGMLNYLVKDKNIKKRFPTMISEYYGDALCMEIYAGMFLLRSHPEKYKELVILSNTALKQYPNYKGELERHLQYRSRIESEHGDPRKAFRILFISDTMKMNENLEEAIDFQVSHTIIAEFMSKCEKQSLIGCQYYIMYYVIIMSEAQQCGDEELADMMYDALRENKKICEMCLIKVKNNIIQDDERNFELQTIATGIAKEEKTQIRYHPLEVILWKYGSYLCGKEHYKEAEKKYIQSAAICFANTDYTTMQVTGMGIYAELIACWLKMNKKSNANKAYDKLVKKMQSIKKKKVKGLSIQNSTLEFINRIEKMLKQAKIGKDELDVSVLIQIARQITY